MRAGSNGRRVQFTTAANLIEKPTEGHLDEQL
jgi:hypothetical protein